MRVYVGPIKGTKGASLDLVFRERIPSPWGSSVSEAPADVRVKVTNSGSFYVVRGEASLLGTFACDRCLKPFEKIVEAEIEEEFHRETEGDETRSDQPFDGEDEPGARDDEEPEHTFEGDAFDLDEVVRESLLLALPSKMLCHEDCLGICPSCGQDLNEATCSCKKEDYDPRLAQLAKLLEQDD